MTDERRASSANKGLLQEKYVSRGLLYRLTTARFFKTLNHLLDKVEATTIFDAGCGEGYVAHHFLKPRFDRIYGADLDMERIHYAAEQYTGLNNIQSNIQQIPFAANTFDLVLCLEVLEHVGNPEHALAELHRVTRRYAILSVPNEPFWRIGNMARGAYWSEWGNTPEHINHWSVWGFKRFVASRFNILAVANPVTWTFILAEKK